MSTPVWKKRLILIVGLFENLVFSGTILGWSSMNYMLKSQGVYQYVCGDLKHEFLFTHNYTEYNKINISLKKTNEESVHQFSTKFKNLNNEFIDLLLEESSKNGKNLTLLEQLEAYQIEPSFSPNYKFQGCGAQDKILNLAYTIGAFCMGFSAFIWGFLLEKWGLKIVRLLISCLITGGTTLLCFTSGDNPVLIFPAVILLSLGGVPLRIANMQFANLYPSKRSTIISLYSGAFCASAIVFVVLKYLFDSGLSYFAVTFLLALTSLLMFPFTLFILPSDRIQEDSECNESNEKTQSFFTRNAFRSSLAFLSPKVTLEKFTLLSSPYFARKSIDFDKQEKEVNDTIDLNNYNFTQNTGINNPIFVIGNILEKEQKTSTMTVSSQNTNVKSVLPLKISLWSLSYNLHQWWFSWAITYMIMYVGSLNLWLQKVTDDIEKAGNFSKIYGCAQVLGLFLAPIGGLIMDASVQKADKETDPFEKKLKRVRAGFWPLFMTTLFLSACLLCRFFNSEIAIYSSIVFMTIFRAFLVAVGTAYLRIRFNGEHFNRLLGIMSTTASIVSLLQFPLFVWESQYPSSSVWVNVLNCFCTLIAFANPIYILVTPLQRYLLHKEEREEAEAKNR